MDLIFIVYLYIEVIITLQTRMDDLEEGIRIYQALLESTPEDHPKRARWLTYLAIGLNRRYQQGSRELQDLDAAINHAETAV